MVCNLSSYYSYLPAHLLPFKSAQYPFLRSCCEQHDPISYFLYYSVSLQVPISDTRIESLDQRLD